MKRKIVGLLAAVLCLAAPALAEGSGGYWTRNADFYYHANENCRSETGMVPISAEAAVAFGKGVCPVCVPAQDDGRDVQAASRGGTIVVCFSDAWLNEPELTGVFGWSGGGSYSGAECQAVLAENLHGDAYNRFMEDYLQNGSAEGRANTPHILSADGLLVMNKRHIGSDWYIVVRPREKFEDSWNMYWRVSSLSLQMEQDTLHADFDQQTVEEIRELKIDRMDGSEPVYQRSGDALDIAVYAALDGNIMVLREKDAADRNLEDVRLRISGAPDGVDIAGYPENDAAVYCCMITDAELEALQNNARVEISHVEQVNSRIYRVVEDEKYTYYSQDGGELLFTIDKHSEADPVDDDFRVVFSGEPDRLVVQTPLEDRLYDFTGTRIETKVDGRNHLTADRITPLAWKGERGVMLAESCSLRDYDIGEMAIPLGMELGEEYDLAEKGWRGRYECWLMDQDGKALTEPQYHESISVQEDGRIVFHGVYEGEIFAQNCDFLVDAD